MSLLNFNNNELDAPRPKKSLKIVAGIGALVGVIALGSTLAASINLNSGAPVEFGQGIAQTTACDSNITITPFSSFTNTEGGGSFKLEKIEISDVDLAACSGKDFIIKAYGTSSSALDFISGISLIKVIDDGTSYSTRNYSGIILEPIDDTRFNLIIDNADPSTLSADQIYGITIESQNHVLEVGDAGPGGGIIFYVSGPTGFNCGETGASTCHYLETTSSEWYGGQYDPVLYWADEQYRTSRVDGITGDIRTNLNLEDIGHGYVNSLAIVNQGNGISTAAGAALAYQGGGQNDWYLPDTTELNLLCQWGHNTMPRPLVRCTGNDGTLTVGNFSHAYYWSSSESSEGDPHDQLMQRGFLLTASKSEQMFVRPIRAF
jgi:hypothetical protein